jgi:hypothetical protein
MPAGMRRVFAETGTPADTLDCAFVNGFMYTRLRPLVGADRPAKKLPPPLVLKAVSRLHPKFRERTKVALARETPGGFIHALRFVINKTWARGMYGSAPSLNPDPANQTLENNGADVAFQTDFRSVYARVIDQWLGADSRSMARLKRPKSLFGRVRRNLTVMQTSFRIIR